METIVEIKYEHYTENIVMNDAAARELKKIAKNYRDYVSHKVIQQGDWAFPAEVKKVMHIGKVNSSWGGKATSVYMYNVSYAGKTITIKSNWPISEIRKGAKSIVKGSQKYNCNSYLKKGEDY